MRSLSSSPQQKVSRRSSSQPGRWATSHYSRQEKQTRRLFLHDAAGTTGDLTELVKITQKGNKPCKNRSSLLSVPSEHSPSTSLSIGGNDLTKFSSEECNVAEGYSFSVEVTVTVGVSIDIPAVAGAGLVGEISKTTAKGTVSNGEVECTGPWACGAIITPKLTEVKGESKTHQQCSSGSPDWVPYTVQFPILKGDLPKYNIEACACKNKPHWGDAGAPQPCLEDC
ncbi:MAG: hypothetical protein M1816_006458 [Peltula sp. TS41687]|nr:MAG: hypothetical protein M1816_006458 [Peltula sp. TS41687]